LAGHDRIRFGVLSTARIGVEKVIPAMQRGALTEVVAIASRDLQRARSTAARLGIPRWHGSYEALLDDADVDAVYIPLPNDQHVPWSILALDTGKHVLCEKPAGTSATDALRLQDASLQHPELKVMEAFMYRHHTQWQTVHALVREGRLGELRTIQTFFSYLNRDPANIRNKVAHGGGALLDIGCYPVSLSRLLFGVEPLRVAAVMQRDPQFGTDKVTSAILDFGSGVSTFTCSTQIDPYQRVWIHGSEGHMEIEIPFNAPPDQDCRLWFSKGGVREEFIVPPCDQYTVQGDHFANAVLTGAPVATPMPDAVANMKVIDAVLASAAAGSWTAV
jgi:predicted dehydrogenase